jgi:hypothetical protein
MLFLTILEGRSPSEAETIFASNDKRLIAVVADAIADRLDLSARRNLAPAAARSIAKDWAAMTAVMTITAPNGTVAAASEIAAADLSDSGVDEAQAWADRVTEAWRESVAGIVKVGRVLIAAQAALKPKRGEWGRLFCRHKDHVPNPVPFGLSMAERLMKIAEHHHEPRDLTRPSGAQAIAASSAWGHCSSA